MPWYQRETEVRELEAGFLWRWPGDSAVQITAAGNWIPNFHWLARMRVVVALWSVAPNFYWLC